MKKNFIKGFTLIELLIVVAIIAILAAIAVPNFLDAQVRAKCARVLSDTRSLITATELYRIDNNKTPPPFQLFNAPPSLPEWWGFAPPALTTPQAFLTSQPMMPFIDKAVARTWHTWTGGSTYNQPYTYVYDVLCLKLNGFFNASRTGQNLPYPGAAEAGLPLNFDASASLSFTLLAEHSSYIYYSAGPDKLDGGVWIRPVLYDPSNGTISFGDIYGFGPGTPEQSGISQNRKAMGG